MQKLSMRRTEALCRHNALAQDLACTWSIGVLFDSECTQNAERLDMSCMLTCSDDFRCSITLSPWQTYYLHCADNGSLDHGVYFHVVCSFPRSECLI